MNVSIFSSMRAYESISLCVSTLAQIQTRLYGKVPVISKKMSSGKLLFWLNYFYYSDKTSETC